MHYVRNTFSMKLIYQLKSMWNKNNFYLKYLPASLGTILQQWIPLLRIKFTSLWSSSMVHGPLFKPTLSQHGCLPIFFEPLKVFTFENIKISRTSYQVWWHWKNDTLIHTWNSSKDAASSYKHLNISMMSLEGGD